MLAKLLCAMNLDADQAAVCVGGVCRRGGGYYGGRGFVFIDPTDFLLIWDPRYRRARERSGRGDDNMTFVEAVFSFVFGDGNPNENFEVGWGWPAAGKRLLSACGCRLN
jgi:hypothetical protein